jgi:hypothetical protein
MPIVWTLAAYGFASVVIGLVVARLLWTHPVLEDYGKQERD